MCTASWVACLSITGYCPFPAAADKPSRIPWDWGRTSKTWENFPKWDWRCSAGADTWANHRSSGALLEVSLLMTNCPQAAQSAVFGNHSTSIIQMGNPVQWSAMALPIDSLGIAKPSYLEHIVCGVCVLQLTGEPRAWSKEPQKTRRLTLGDVENHLFSVVFLIFVLLTSVGLTQGDRFCKFP